MPRSSNRRLAVLMAAVLMLAACGGRTPAAPDARADLAACGSGCVDELSASCTAGDDMSAAINEGVRFVGQVYTAGHTGTLSGVNVSVRSNGGQFGLRVAIRQAVGGLPTQVVLGSTTLATPESPFDSLVQFPSPIQQVAGQQYAIVVDYPGAPPIGNMQGAWEGMSTDCYAGGSDVGSVDGITWASTNDDLHFRVFIRTN